MSSKSKVVAIVLLLAVVVTIPVLLLQRRARLPDDKVSRVAIMSMKSDLRGLVMAQAASRRLVGRYDTDPERLGHLSSPGVTPPVIVVQDTGWSATVSHKTIAGIRCAVGVYNRNPLKRFAKSGEIVCE